MQLIITGKNMEITDMLRGYVEKKIGKLDRYLSTITEARVELTRETTKSAADSHVVQVTLRTARGPILRGEERSGDIFTSIDAVLDKMYKQITRYKGKRQRRGRSQQGETAPLEEEEQERPGRIVRIKRFQMLPMDAEEAIEQMELLGHNFFVFYNAESGEVNVIYRRRDGNYGLIEPELA
ncbi:MAG: ribosome hibernation-promoting factor, HPF/YfiA family [Anaerolineae bacterium]